MKGNWELRRSGPEDETFLWEMLFYASHSDYEEGVEPSDIRADPLLVGYVEGWKLADCPGVIAGAKDGPIGAAWLRLHTESERGNPVFVDPHVPEMAAAILPGRQGEGIGTAMIESLLDLARDRFGAVVLSVRANSPATGLYERLGFRKVGEITNRIGTQSVKMIVDL
jgi:ribosomal protein S18 acetylase RimI-like enzyme